MMAHGISNEISNLDDVDKDHTSYDWAPHNASKCMDMVCTNSNRLKSSRVGEHYGIECSSWKPFLGHGKCTLDEADSNAQDSFPGLDIEEGLPRGSYEHKWSKRKRPYGAKVGSIVKPNCPSSEEEDLAHCLMMLSNGIVEPFYVAETEESCASASKEEGRRHHLNPYSQSNYKSPTQYEKGKFVIPKGLFECKACKKVFNSHQALGGHRASHKKVKGCFAAKLDNTDDNEPNLTHGMITQDKLYHTKLQYDQTRSSVRKKEKVHECSICYRVFSSGQALGGHKRCHWITSKNTPDHASRSSFKFDNSQIYDQAEVELNNMHKDSETLDLTLDLKFHALETKPQNNQIAQKIFVLPRVGGDDSEKDRIYTTNQKIEKLTNDETETKTKFDKLTELKGMKSSLHWLQVGLGSTSSQAGSGPL